MRAAGLYLCCMHDIDIEGIGEDESIRYFCLSGWAVLDLSINFIARAAGLNICNVRFVYCCVIIWILWRVPDPRGMEEAHHACNFGSVVG